jgi:ATP-dependent Lon protease
MSDEAAQRNDQRASHPPLPPDSMIILPVRQAVLFPGMVLPLAIGRPSSIAATQKAVRSSPSGMPKETS